MPKDTPARQKSKSFEKSLEQLENLIVSLEEGELPLEESLKAFEKGIQLTRECQQYLADAEQKVTQLVGDDEDMTLVEFNKDVED